jgi:error-prone DNA polymerase
VVITSRPVQSVAPLQRSAKGYQILLWEKDGTEAMGLVKIDLLGNRSLAVSGYSLVNYPSGGQ